MEYLGKFGERLRYLINFNNDTAETLGAKLNVSGRTVRAWMRGETLILLPHAVALADHFCCSLDFLAGRSEHEERVEPRPLPPFYPRLRAVLNACNTTRYRVTADTSVKDSHFTNWSKGRAPKLTSVCILADYLHVTLDYLVGRTDY